MEVLPTLMNGFKPLTVFSKWNCQGFLAGSRIRLWLNNNFRFCSLAWSIIVYLQIPLGSSLFCVETSQFIWKANWLVGFYMVQVFAGGISEQNIVQFYSRKQPSQSVLSFLYLRRFHSWWFCRLLAFSFT